MQALAEKLGESVELWGVVGLLHDLDFEETAGRPAEHGLKTAAILAETDLPPDAITAIKAHNAEVLGVERKSKVDHALTCAESVTGLVVATALVYPDKRLASVKPKSVLKRMKKKDFARRVNRDHIRLCEEIGVPVWETLPYASALIDRVGRLPINGPSAFAATCAFPWWPASRMKTRGSPPPSQARVCVAVRL